MTNTITITVPHRLSQAEAKTRITASVDQFKQQMASVGLGQIRHDWQGERLNLHAQCLGQAIKGRVEVSERDLKIEFDLPALLARFADAIKGRLRQAGTKLLEKK